MEKTIILVPRLNNTGPVKGAIALQNGLKKLGSDCEIQSVFAHDNNSRGIVSSIIAVFTTVTNIRKKQLNGAIIISFCLQPDLLVALFAYPKKAIISLRGNLRQNYIDTYGFLGPIIAHLHYIISGFFKHRTVLNWSMKKEIESYGHDAIIIKNFIDELSIQRQYEKIESDETFNFVFVGGLIKRKGVMLLLNTFYNLVKEYKDIKLHLVGDGPEMRNVKNFIEKNNLQEAIFVYGYLSDPLEIVKVQDYFVLPSSSEGTSRAAMEALYLGLPCIMRDVDSNAELIQSMKQGYLFGSDSELFFAMETVLKQRKTNKEKSRLPDEFNQLNSSQSYLDLIRAI